MGTNCARGGRVVLWCWVNFQCRGWSGGVKVLGKLPVSRRPIDLD